MSVGDKLRFGAYAGVPVSADTSDLGKITDRTEIANNRTMKATFNSRLAKNFHANMAPRRTLMGRMG
ncbi:MAG TPA: hypothetical protein VEI80_05875 [Candidatus Acidoferrales bacterium]|nr:hypothetical protein [Candidatus Acidoferrales bacterium]